MSANPGGPNDNKADKPADAPQPGVSANPPVSREGEAEPQSVGEGGAPATKDELATDLSEIARARLANTDKSIETESRAAHAADLARGVAGKDADDGTAAQVEAAPTAAVGLPARLAAHLVRRGEAQAHERRPRGEVR